MSLEDLKIRAKETAKKAYAPYSKFRVGCAIMTKSGNIYVGCNVENMSFGLTICAERNAIFSAISVEGKIEISDVVVYTETNTPASPCGACRQIIYEFCGNETNVHAFCDTDKTYDTTIGELLPKAFNLNDY